MNPYSRLFSRHCGFFYTADKGGPAGGGGAQSKTVPELVAELEQANKDKTAAEGKAADAQTKLTASETKVADLQGKLTAAETKVTEIEGKLTAAETKVKDLTTANETAAQTGREQAAAAGVTTPVTKPAGSVTNPGAVDGKQHYDAYQAAMNANDGRKAAEIWAANEKAITAYVATLEKDAAR